MDNNRFTELVNLYLLDRISDREGAELAAMMELPDYQAQFERRLHEQMHNKEFDLETPPMAVHDRIQTFLEAGTKTAPQPIHRVHFLRRSFWRIAAVAMLAVAGVYVYQRAKTPALLSQAKRFRNDIRPGNRQATMTLADGSRVGMTDSLATLKTNGEIHIVTGKGETYSLVLSDGTKIWLNSSSSLSCPVVFSGGRRSVKFSGEGYFEVQHDAKNPFSVELPDGTLVKDLGTKFNIHAYGDEKAVRTTVLEGAVVVETQGHELSLVPGEQAEYSEKEELIKRGRVNLPGIVAWKEEKFVLEATPISEIMKQVERWYGAEIQYKDNMQTDTTEFFGTLTRNVPVSELLKTLEATGHVHFMIEENRITVMK